MLKSLFVQFCIVITFLFLGGSIFRFSPYLYSLRQKLFFGTLSGVLGSVLMIFTIPLTPTIIMDYRHIAILFSALYGGTVSTLATIFIICFSRLVFIGGSPLSLFVSTSMMISIGFFSAFICKTNLSELKKWIYMYLVSLVILSGGFGILLGVTKEFINLMVKYWCISIIAGALIFYCVKYIVHSNRSFYDMKKQSATDYLTGLNNVRQFHSAFDDSVEKAIKHDEHLSFLMIDIDNFKTINDTYGHEAGDEVLRQAGALFSSCSRSFDILARIGGDEFSLLLLNCSNQQAKEISERIRTSIEKYEFNLPGGKTLHFTVSIGISTFPETTNYPEHLFKQADKALYIAKHAGRNKVVAIELS